MWSIQPVLSIQFLIILNNEHKINIFHILGKFPKQDTGIKSKTNQIRKDLIINN